MTFEHVFQQPFKLQVETRERSDRIQYIQITELAQ